MAFEGLNITQITETHLTSLIGIPEGRNLEFKQETYGANDAAKKELLADVSSIANTAGGHLIIGVKETAGKASEISGIEANVDQEKLRLEDIIRTGVQPRIVGAKLRAVTLTSGRHVLILEIPRSWIGPHRVIANHRFWLRNSAGKYEPDVNELRDLFTLAPLVKQKISDFRFDRVAKIAANTGAVELENLGVVILHVIPFSAFSTGDVVDLNQIRNDLLGAFAPLGGSSFNFHINFDGIVTYSGTPAPAYTQVWRSGIIEGVRGPIITQNAGATWLPFGRIARLLINGLRSGLSGLRTLQQPLPAAIFVTILNAKGSLLTSADEFAQGVPIDRDIYLPEIILEDYPASDDDIPLLLKPAFDLLANAGGYSEAPLFNSLGSIISGR